MFFQDYHIFTMYINAWKYPLGIRTMHLGGLLLTLYLCASVCDAGHIVMSPVSEKPETSGGRDVGFVLIPELGIPHSDYESLCEYMHNAHAFFLFRYHNTT